MSEQTAVAELLRRAEKARAGGNLNIAELLETNAAKGEAHAAQYIEMMTMVGNAARRIREREGF